MDSFEDMVHRVHEDRMPSERIELFPSRKRGKKVTPSVSSGSLEERALRALRRVWSSIFGDALAMYGDPEKVVISAEEVIDWVGSEGFGKNSLAWIHSGDYEAMEWFESQSTQEQERLLQKAFPSDRSYGA